MLPSIIICGTLPSAHSPTVHILHRMCKSGKVRRLACPLRRFPFICPTELWGKGGAAGTKGGISVMVRSTYASFLHVPFCRIGRLRRPPPIPLRGTSPYSGGRIKPLYACHLPISYAVFKAGCCAPACGGKVVAPATKGGIAAMACSTYDSFRFLPTPSTAYAVPLRPGGKRLTWFSGRFAPLRTKFACHLQAGGGKFKVYVVPPPRWQVLVYGRLCRPIQKGALLSKRASSSFTIHYFSHSGFPRSFAALRMTGRRRLRITGTRAVSE